MAQPVIRMALASGLLLAGLLLASGPGDRLPVALGWLGPLLVTIASWTLVERVHLGSPERVSALMVKLFGAKMLLFGGFAAAVLIRLPGSRVAFIVSFTAQYILLHVMEALYLRRLCSSETAAPGR